MDCESRYSEKEYTSPKGTDVFFLNGMFIKSRESNSEINRDLILFRLMKTQCFDFILLLFDVTEITSTDNHSRIFFFSLIIKE